MLRTLRSNCQSRSKTYRFQKNFYLRLLGLLHYLTIWDLGEIEGSDRALLDHLDFRHAASSFFFLFLLLCKNVHYYLNVALHCLLPLLEGVILGFEGLILNWEGVILNQNGVLTSLKVINIRLYVNKPVLKQIKAYKFTWRETLVIS